MRWPLLLAALTACKVKDPPPVTEEWKDTYDRAEIGGDYYKSGGGYEIVDGQLSARGAHNHPLWLRKRLPRDVRIELDAWSTEARGDIKLELFGDGESFDPDKGAYTSSGYVLIFGGWGNSLSVICRQDEHGAGRKAARADIRVEPGRNYHFTITRRGGALDWAIDGRPFLAWTDPEPLAGPGHEFLAVDDWEAELTFDNLQVRPAP